MNKDYVPYNVALALEELGFKKPCHAYFMKPIKNSGPGKLHFGKLNFKNRLSTPTFQEAFDWFEDEHNIYVQRAVSTSVNEILDFTYHLKSWRFPPVEIEFEEPYDSFDRYKARIACLEKMIEIIKAV
jgi:hypothetical protein